MKFPWIGVIGSIILFASWTFQNVYLANQQGGVSDIRRTQQQIDVAQLRLEMWNAIHLAESNSDEPRSVIQNVAAHKMIQALTNISAWSSDDLSASEEELQEIYNKKAILHSMAKEYFESGDTEQLESLLIQVVTTTNNTGEELINRRIERRNGQASNAVIATWLFVLLYILGSVLVGIQWMLSREGSRTHNKSIKQDAQERASS